MTSTMPKPHQWTRSEYVEMFDAGVFEPQDRLELIEGEIVDMSPQNCPHATGVTLVQETLSDIFRSSSTIRVQLPMDVNEISQPEPDIAVVEGKARDYLNHHPMTALLIVEVSDTTLDYDRETKSSLYAKAGIEDYWIVNLADRQLEVYRCPASMANRPFGFGYKQINYYTDEDSISPLAPPESSIDVADFLP